MDYELLLRSRIFKGLAIKELIDIFNKIPFRLRKYKPGAVVALSGEPVENLLLVISGAVKGEMVDYAGRIIKIEDIPAAEALAPAFIFGNKNIFPVNVVTLTETEILIINKKDFLRIMMSDDRILANFLDMISNRSQFLSEKIKFLNFKTIKAKLAQYILQLDINNETFIRLNRTQNDLADFFGVARPSVGRAIHELEEEGYILADRKEIKILDREGLSVLTKM
jgi:CRP-like cAMP-binding protein